MTVYSYCILTEDEFILFDPQVHIAQQTDSGSSAINMFLREHFWSCQHMQDLQQVKSMLKWLHNQEVTPDNGPPLCRQWWGRGHGTNTNLPVGPDIGAKLTWFMYTVKSPCTWFNEQTAMAAVGGRSGAGKECARRWWRSSGVGVEHDTHSVDGIGEVGKEGEGGGRGCTESCTCSSRNMFWPSMVHQPALQHRRGEDAERTCVPRGALGMQQGSARMALTPYTHCAPLGRCQCQRDLGIRKGPLMDDVIFNDVNNPEALKQLQQSLTDNMHTGQHPVASSSKSAVKVPPEELEALFSSNLIPHGRLAAPRPDVQSLLRRIKDHRWKSCVLFYYGDLPQLTSSYDSHHHLSKTPRPSHQEPHRTRDHVDLPHPTVPTDTTLMGKQERKPTLLLEQMSKPNKGKGMDPLERGWPGIFKDGLLHTQLLCTITHIL
ncbi:hypothetical protein JB92DRAFT_2827701 [Gautieria morchelliformis]|nr:hypothetical protein JB92DRAFT_2827701 [Gautieria morchelliformis]